MPTITLNTVSSKNLQLEEIYKTLRANIQFAGTEVKTIVFTSCIPNEGKSTVVIELGAALAAAGKRTLIIDADLRKSVLASRHNVRRSSSGLSEFLAGTTTLREVLLTTNIPNLQMILSGPFPPNPAEMLGGKAMQNLLKSARNAYDYVLIDAPPLGSVIDAAVLAQYVDASVLIIGAGAISYRFAQEVKDQLKRTNCPILGVVLNKVDQKKTPYYSHYGSYYGKYYGKYYGEGNGKSGKGSRKSSSKASAKHSGKSAAK